MGTTLDLTDIRVLSLPDGGLKELNPWTIEKSIRDELLRVEPHVVVTCPIHGISGFRAGLITEFLKPMKSGQGAAARGLESTQQIRPA